MTPVGPCRERGFSLLECLAAMVLIGFALLIATAFLNTMAGSAAQLNAQTELLRRLNAAAESVRSGQAPLRSGPMLLDPGVACARLTDFHLWLEVTSTDRQGLYEITIHGRCTLHERALRRSLTTMIWRPS